MYAIHTTNIKFVNVLSLEVKIIPVPKHHMMNTHKTVEEDLHAFLTSPLLHGGEQPASCMLQQLHPPHLLARRHGGL
jgi:hypothetical protein